MGNRVKEPVTKGVCKVPTVMQLEALECGAACLAMVLAYYEKWIPLEQVRKDCGVSRDGANAKNIVKAARHYGLKAEGYRFEPEALKNGGLFPCIVHWNFNHFVVLNGFRNNKAYINDPARGTYAISMEEFDKAFTGICLMFEPDESFEPSGKQKSMVEFAKKRLTGTKRAIIFTATTGIIAALVNLINPAFSQVFLDRILPRTNPEWMFGFFVILGIFCLVQVVMSGVDAVYRLRISGKMATIGDAQYIWKVLHMPMEFFSQRMAGDIQNWMKSNANIANTLINTFAPLLLNTVMMVIYGVIMIRYSLPLTLVGLLSVGINSWVSRSISKKRTNITRVSMRDSAKLNSTTVAGIEMVETIKASGAENGYFNKWSGFQANVNTQQIKFLKLNQYLGMVPTFVSGLANNAVLILGVFLIMQGELTSGMIMAFQAYLASFMAPANTIISAGQTLLEMRTEMERVDDVMEYPSDDAFAELDINEKDHEYSKLTGKIELKNVEFGYSPLANPLIVDFNLSLESGKSVAIVGFSGCGKSTISKLMSGLYKPWSGEILYDGRPLRSIDKDTFTGSLAVVDQDVILFEDTIANNIKMWDNTIEDFEMILAARDARLHEDIMARPGGYQHKLLEGGKDLSGGQRQRMEIARVLAQDPTIVIMDEATSALDAKTEYEVVKAIRDRGITTVVIAHRLSTIRDCDEIIVMDKGRIVDRGTHEQLIKYSNIYNNLVASD